MTLGLVALGSNRSARLPFTLNSSAWLSVVPTNCVPGVVPLLPPVCQKFVALNPFNATAFTPVTFAPLPAKEVAATVPEKLGLPGNEAFKTVPPICAAGSVPNRLLALLANTAYGA